MTTTHKDPRAVIDRSDAVNLARNISEHDRDDITQAGIRILCDAVLRMDAALTAGREALEQTKAKPVAYIAWRDGKPCYEGDDAVCEDAVWPIDSDDDRTSMPVYTHPQASEPAPSTAVELAPKANMFHDAGAMAQCQKCKRYTLDGNAIGSRDSRQPVCTCGQQHYWSGSFKPPGPDAQWHGPAPAALLQSAPDARPVGELTNRLDSGTDFNNAKWAALELTDAQIDDVWRTSEMDDIAPAISHTGGVRDFARAVLAAARTQPERDRQ